MENVTCVDPPAFSWLKTTYFHKKQCLGPSHMKFNYTKGHQSSGSFRCSDLFKYVMTSPRSPSSHTVEGATARSSSSGVNVSASERTSQLEPQGSKAQRLLTCFQPRRKSKNKMY